jgi:hypothetical protein
MAEPVEFIKKSLTALNPQDVFYKNYDEHIRYYFLLILIGMLMVAYMMLR